MTDTQQSAPLRQQSDTFPPTATKRPSERTAHGDVFQDPYAWMRHSDSQEVRAYVEAQNRYCVQRTAHLKTLGSTLFDELRSHVQETDMSVPTRIHDYWYFARTREGSQYAIQCRVPVTDPEDWTPPNVEPDGEPGSLPGEHIVYDANKESQGHEFFALGGLDLDATGRWLLYGVDVHGNERYDFRIRELATGRQLPEMFTGIGSACITPDGQWVFYTVLDEAWRPCAVKRHRVGTAVDSDVEVFREEDQRFWVGVSVSFDETRMMIETASKTTTEVWLLGLDDPAGQFDVFVPRREGVEYEVGFSKFERPESQGGDVPVALVCHNLTDPNFQIDVIELTGHEPPYRLGEGEHIAFGSPYGCERGDEFERGASSKPVSAPWRHPANPGILQGVRGLAIEGVSLYHNFVVLAYRAQGLPYLAMMTKQQAWHDLEHRCPWSFRPVTPPPLPEDDRHRNHATAEHDEPLGSSDEDTGSPSDDPRLYSITAVANPSYDAPTMRYSFASYTRPAELHEIEPASGRDHVLKRAQVLGDFDPQRYSEKRIWVKSRDGEHVPVSLVWRSDVLKDASAPSLTNRPMFITGYGAYGISLDPAFSVPRLSLLDRGVLYAVVHVRGGGEMGRAWYEQGRRHNKRNTFTDFIDVTLALQNDGLADPARTVANGGSAGGLLMGAVANLAPERYAGIEADVPFVDVLTTMLDPSLPLTVTEWDEWGDPVHDQSAYDDMRSYSPYENAPDESHPAAVFPKILITSSMHDTRVLVDEPLKWLARLQSAGVDAIAKIEVEAGHGGTSGRYRRWEQISFENAWCLDVIDARERLDAKVD